MQFLLRGLLFFFISVLLRPKPPTPKPATLDDLNVPRASEGDEVGKVYGTVWIKSPQVVWYGDLLSTPITSRSGKK